MLDDFRQQADAFSNFDEDENQDIEPERRVHREFLGMSPFQRFMVSLLLLVLTLMLGSFWLLVTNRVVPPL